MSYKIYESIKSAWDDAGLDANFPGGLWFGEARRGSTFPYVVMTSLGNNTKGWTSDSEIRTHSVQFKIFWKENGSTDPVATVGGLIGTLENFIKNGTFTLSSDGHVLSARRKNDDITKDPHTDKVWSGRLDVDFLRDKAA